MKGINLIEEFNSDVIRKKYEIFITEKFDMFVMTELNFNDKGVFVTQNNVQFELRTIIMIKNNTEQKQSNKWFGIVYYIHGGKHSSCWKQQQKYDFVLQNRNLTFYDVPKLDDQVSVL